MLKIGILEDEKSQSDELMNFLEQYRSAHPDFQYTATVFDTAGRLLFNYANDYDLLFMDIRLPDMLGMDAARQIRKMDENVMIVFVTNLTQYAIEGYSVNAYDYILKPLLFGAFSAKLSRILKVLNHRCRGEWILVQTKQERFHIETGSILYIEVDSHDLVFHTEGREYHVWGTLAQYEEKLPAGFFSRCKACYLVNLRYVDAVCGNTVTVHGIELAVSRNRRKDFLSDLARYKGGSI